MALPQRRRRSLPGVGPLLAIALALGAAGCAEETGPIRIGLAGPFSEARGESMRLAAELAVEEINRGGGIGGRPLELVIRDDSASADVAIRVAQELYDTPGLVAVIGHLTSGSTLAAAPIYNGGRDPVVQITPSASAPQVSEAGPYTFRVCPSDLAHAAELAVWARRRLEADVVAVLYHNDEYGRGVRRAFAERFRQLGGRVAVQYPYLPSTGSVAPYIERIARLNGVDAVMIAGSRREAERFLAEMTALGLELPVLGADGLAGLERPAGRSAPVFVSLAYAADQPGEANRQFVERYRAAHRGRLPDHRGAGSWDAVHMLARAMRQEGAEREAIARYLSGVGTASEAFDGATGTIEFDSAGDLPARRVLVREVAAAR